MIAVRSAITVRKLGVGGKIRYSQVPKSRRLIASQLIEHLGPHTESAGEEEREGVCGLRCLLLLGCRWVPSIL